MDKLFVVGQNTDCNVKNKLSECGSILELKPHKSLANPVSCHPDMIFSVIAKNTVVYAPDCDENILADMSNFGIELICGKTFLKDTYPYDIAYNTLTVDRIFYHNIYYTDSVVLSEYAKREILPVNVKQGYTGCSSKIICRRSGKIAAVTSDMGMYKAMQSQNINVFYFKNFSKIALPGYDHGFIGGCCGYDNEADILYIMGNLDDRDRAELTDFVDDGIDLIELGLVGNSPKNTFLADFGGILIFTR
ncbi:MAG: hypothetical protein LBI03_05625 [Clostridiales bacterium]|nr:hypothetical protein [Clostridiales bacterium]